MLGSKKKLSKYTKYVFVDHLLMIVYGEDISRERERERERERDRRRERGRSREAEGD